MLRWWYISRYTRCRKGREVHKMEDEITRSDFTLNSTPDHVLADFLSDLLLHLVNLLVFLVDLVLHLVHLPVLHLVHPPPPNHHPTSPQQPWPTLLSPLASVAPKGVKILKERFFWDTLYLYWLISFYDIFSSNPQLNDGVDRYSWIFYDQPLIREREPPTADSKAGYL